MIRSFLLALLILLGTFQPSSGIDSQAPLKIVVSFSILGNIVSEVGGTAIEVKTLVGPNQDAHIFQPTVNTSLTIANADLVFINGLGFEGWLGRLIESSGYKGPIIICNEGIHPRDLFDEQTAKKIHDPHTWLSITNVLMFVECIEKTLIKALPDKRAYISKRATLYKAKLKALDRQIRTKLSQIPLQKRRVITAHDAFGYCGADYGIEFMAPQGISTESAPSAQGIAKLIHQIKHLGVRAIFVENIANEKLIRSLVEETGIEVQGTLYSDALSEDGQGAETYLKLMTHNFKLLLSAMNKNA